MKTMRAALMLGLMSAGIPSAYAADLGASAVGGNCCSDLEERIAELEATTAKKGNRKVSLTISGWVSQQVSFWDDGVEKNAYVSDLGSTLNSNFKLTGNAQINTGWSAGYVLHVEVVGNENLALNADTSAAGKGLAVIQSFWYLKSNTLGKLSVGTQSSAADNAALLPDGSGSLVFANYIMYDINAFSTRFAADKSKTGFNWGSLATCQAFSKADGLGLGMDCDGVPNNVVRYDTPTVAGFSASASWGEDDIWAVSGRYAGEFNGIKLSAAIGYFENTDDNGAATRSVNPAGVPAVAASKEGAEKARGGKQASALQIGAYVQHIPTGLFVYGAYGHDYNDRTGALNGLGQQQKDGENFYIKAGVRQRWSPLGHTVVYGEYGENRNKQSNDLWAGGVTNSNLTQWGLGIVQEIDQAAMSIFMNYRHYSADATCGAFADDNFNTGSASSNFSCGAKNGFSTGGYKIKLEDAQLFKVGALINF